MQTGTNSAVIGKMISLLKIKYKLNRFHGKGAYIFANAERYEGDLLEGKK